jgi:hypothetical protein
MSALPRRTFVSPLIGSFGFHFNAAKNVPPMVSEVFPLICRKLTALGPFHRHTKRFECLGVEACCNQQSSVIVK